jgi:hypothetical protein
MKPGFSVKNAVAGIALWLATGLIHAARSPFGVNLHAGESAAGFFVLHNAVWIFLLLWIPMFLPILFQRMPNRMKRATHFLELFFGLVIAFYPVSFAVSNLVFPLFLLIFLSNRITFSQITDAENVPPAFSDPRFPMLFSLTGVFVFWLFYVRIYDIQRVDQALKQAETLWFVYGVTGAMFVITGSVLLAVSRFASLIHKHWPVFPVKPVIAFVFGWLLAATLAETLGPEVDLVHQTKHIYLMALVFPPFLMLRIPERLIRMKPASALVAQMLKWAGVLTCVVIAVAIHRGLFFDPWFHIFSMVKGFVFVCLMAGASVLLVQLLPGSRWMNRLSGALLSVVLTASMLFLAELDSRPSLKWALIQYEEYPRVYLSFIRQTIPDGPVRRWLGLGSPKRHKPEYRFANATSLEKSGNGLLGSHALNLILIDIDALRADVVFDRDSSVYQPVEFQQWMDTSAVVFTRAYSPSNSSYRSLALLFGAEGNRHTLYPVYGLENTLSEWLRNGSYAPLVLSEGNGVAGFFRKDDPLVLIGQPVDHSNGRNQPAGEQITKFLAALPASSDSVPFFGYMHWMDVHNDLYAKPGIPLERDTPFDLYRHNVRYQSGLWPAFIDSLKRRGLYDNTMIVILGDHGEEFKEHESTLHGHHFFEQDMHVPLVWRIPGVDPKQINTQVSTADWIPTLFELTGYRLSSPQYPDGYVESQAGRIMSGDTMDVERVRSFYFQSNMTDKIGLMHAGRWKYEYWPTYDAEALFDLNSDPTEHRNAVSQHRTLADSLKKVVFGWSSRMNGHRY